MIEVVVSGGAGKMGRTVIDAVCAQDDIRLVAAVDPAHAGETIETCKGSIVLAGSLKQTIAESTPDVVVDFTNPSVVEDNIQTTLAAGVDCVVGTTGLSHDRLAELAQAAPENTALFFAPNFTLGAVLMMQFAQRAARYLPNVEIIEYHHDQKKDAPSGTAITTAHLVSEARSEIPDAPGKETEIPGAEGARGALISGIPVHSVRMPGYVAHQEVIFGSPGQTLTIRHDSIERTSYMPGVLLAIRSVGALSGLTIGLDALLED